MFRICEMKPPVFMLCTSDDPPNPVNPLNKALDLNRFPGGLPVHVVSTPTSMTGGTRSCSPFRQSAGQVSPIKSWQIKSPPKILACGGVVASYSKTIAGGRESCCRGTILKPEMAWGDTGLDRLVLGSSSGPMVMASTNFMGPEPASSWAFRIRGRISTE